MSTDLRGRNHSTWMQPARVRQAEWPRRLCGLFVGVVLVVAALRRVLAVVAQLGQLFIEGLDGGFLLAKDFLYQLVAMGFERLLLGEGFIDRIVGHVNYDPIARKAAGDRMMTSAAVWLKGREPFRAACRPARQLRGRRSRAGWYG